MTYNVFGGTFNLAQLPLQLGEGPDSVHYWTGCYQSSQPCDEFSGNRESH